MEFLKSSTFTLITRVTKLLLGLVLSVVVARALGPEGKGSFAFFTTATMFLLLFSRLGLGQANGFYIGSRRYPKEELAGTGLITGFVACLLLSIGVTVYLVRYYPGFLGAGTNSWVIFLLIFSAPAMVINHISGYVFLANDLIVHYNLVGLGHAALTVVFAVLSVVIAGSSIEGIIIGYVCSVVIVAIVSIITLYRDGLMQFVFRFQLFRLLIQYGVRSNIGNIAQGLFLRLDYFIVGAILGAEAVGLYTVAVALMEKFLHIPRSMSPILFQKVSNEFDNPPYPFIRSLYRKTMLVSIAGIIGLALVTRPLIMILYPGFERAVEAAYILLPGIFMLGLFEISAGVLLGRGQSIPYTVCNLLAIILDVVLCFVLVPRWNINGAAIASTVAYTVASLTALFFFVRISDSTWKDLMISRDDWHGLSRPIRSTFAKHVKAIRHYI